MSFMLEEIKEQSAVIERTIKEEKEKIKELAFKIAKKEITLIIIAARGTSDNAATLGKYLFEHVNGIPVSLAAPSIYTIYNSTLKLNRTLVIGISQSGESIDILEVVKKARAQGALTIGVTNEVDSSLAKSAEHTIFCHAGKERSVAATKTYTAQLTILYLLSGYLRSDGKMVRMIAGIPKAVKEVLSLESYIAERAERYRYMDHCLITARGFNYATAQETALKLKETCYVVAEPSSAADLFHGPIALIEKGFPVFIFAPEGKTYPLMLKLAKSLFHRRAETIIFASNREILNYATTPIKVPLKIEELLTPIPYIVPAQLFTYYLSLKKGFDPDEPRGLRKVTLTR